MYKPEEMPKVVVEALEKWSLFHNQPIPEVFWYGQYYAFTANGIFHGVELDGYIHT